MSAMRPCIVMFITKQRLAFLSPSLRMNVMATVWFLVKVCCNGSVRLAS